MATKIEWCDETLNPRIGCTAKPISAGCLNCYAARFAKRMVKMGFRRYEPVVDDAGRWTGETRTCYACMDKIENWRKPRRVFIGSMGDTFCIGASETSESLMSRVSALIQRCAQFPAHRFLFLTKRPAMMLRVMVVLGGEPPPNIWWGVTIEDCVSLALRQWDIRQIARYTRNLFVSAEPLLEDISTEPLLATLPVRWVICGAETGPGARAFSGNWANRLRAVCDSRGIAFFAKRCPGARPDTAQRRQFPSGL